MSTVLHSNDYGDVFYVCCVYVCLCLCRVGVLSSSCIMCTWMMCVGLFDIMMYILIF